MRTAKSKTLKQTVPRLPAVQFWGLCIVIYMLLQFPLVRIPINFLSTWIHELGHGLGAIFTGATFREFVIRPNFSGTAYTLLTKDSQHLCVLFLGLLGPSLLGAILIILTRALSRYRLSLIFLTALLLMSQIWAADMFTRGTLAGAALLTGLLAWKAPRFLLLYFTQITAIALCLNAITDFGYFFMGGFIRDGQVMQSDTSKIGEILGGPYWLWGSLITLLSVIILVLAVYYSDRWARRKDEKSQSIRPAIAADRHQPPGLWRRLFGTTKSYR